MESASSVTLMSLSDDKPRRKRTLDDKACEVCNDKSTGKHYGVYCCDGCSGFFKRTVRRSIPWLCRHNNQCIVDRASRTDCRACRFKKCLRVNMNPEGVQSQSSWRTSYEEREKNSRGMSLSDFEKAGESAKAVDNFCSSSATSFPTTSRSFSDSCSSSLVSMAISGANDPERSDSPVLIKMEKQQCDNICDTFSDSDGNSEVVVNNSQGIAHNTENSRNNSDIDRKSSAIVERSLDIVVGSIGSRTGNVLSSEAVKGSISTKNGSSGIVTIFPPVGPAAPLQQSQVNPTRMLVTHPYPYQSGNYHMTSPTSHYGNTDHQNCTPGNTELSIVNAESACNMAVKLLSNCVQFAKNIHCFKSLPFRDQIILLEESWKDLVILDAAFWSFPPIVSRSIPPKETSLLSSLRVLQELLARIQSLEIDKSESEYLKTVVLFKAEIKGLKDSQQIEKHQDEALIKLSDYVKITHVGCPARYGRLLLMLSTFQQVSPEVIEKLFFPAQNNGVEYILHDLFQKT